MCSDAGKVNKVSFISQSVKMCATYKVPSLGKRLGSPHKLTKPSQAANLVLLLGGDLPSLMFGDADNPRTEEVPTGASRGKKEGSGRAPSA